MGQVTFTTVDHAAAERLLADRITIIDVRTPREHEELGHIPGSLLIPVDLIASAPAVLDKATTRVLVYCEHGVRSRAASELLVAAGINEVFNLAGGLEPWRGPREFGAGRISGPSTWLLENADLLPRGGRVLDVACGRGRHALLMAAAGFQVTAIDRNADAIGDLRTTADRLHLPIVTELIDLETDPPPALGSQTYDAILGFNYLHRPLMPALKDATKARGRIFYETFTRRQAQCGHPRNPAFLLEDGELETLLQPFTIVRARSGDIDGRWIAAVVAQREK